MAQFYPLNQIAGSEEIKAVRQKRNRWQAALSPDHTGQNIGGDTATDAKLSTHLPQNVTAELPQQELQKLTQDAIEDARRRLAVAGGTTKETSTERS
jgi:hypothetical protein